MRGPPGDSGTHWATSGTRERCDTRSRARNPSSSFTSPRSRWYASLTRDPVGTYETNVIGTVNVLEACRQCAGEDLGGGHQRQGATKIAARIRLIGNPIPWAGPTPTRAAKAAAELATAAYRQLLLRDARAGRRYDRAGNVIGGGDFAAERLIPDLVRAFLAREQPVIRNPHAIRPWQHVLEPLTGYLLLAERLLGGARSAARAWNFGPQSGDAKPVAWVVQRALSLLGTAHAWVERPEPVFPEAANLRLDSRDARERLGWHPRLSVDTALEWTIDWYRDWQSGKDVRTAALDQIRKHGALAAHLT